MIEYKFSKHSLERIKERKIKERWIFKTIENPDEIIKVSDTEHRYYKVIEEFGNRILKVVINPEKRLIITVYFDRGKKLWK